MGLRWHWRVGWGSIAHMQKFPLVIAAVVGCPPSLHQLGGNDGRLLEVIEELFLADVVVLELLVHAANLTPLPAAASTR